MKNIAIGVTIAALVAAAAVAARQPQATRTTHNVTQSDMDRWKKELSNWGRWGKDDEKGTLNLITAAKRKQAAALVKEGFAVSLARDAATEKDTDNPQPYEDVMLSDGSTRPAATDRISVAFHGLAHTHFDALAHHFIGGKMYNGFSQKEYVSMKGGATKASVYQAKGGVFTRSILMDIPRLKGVPYLEPGTPIYIEDLEAWEKQAGIRVSAGDALFVRTGVWARRKAVGPWLRGRAEGGRSAGLDPSVIPWLKQRDIAILGSDHPQYVAPSPVRGVPTGAIHDFALLYLGVHLFDNCDLEALAETAAARKRWEFLLTAAPLAIPGGTGSPINPIATF